jgi:hypothetical protein
MKVSIDDVVRGKTQPALSLLRRLPYSNLEQLQREERGEAGSSQRSDRLFDSMNSVVGDRAVAQADHSLPRCDGAIDASAATKLSQQQEQCEQSAQSHIG